jgi:uncharacterized membrane protein
MEELFATWAAHIALFVEAGSVLIIAAGSLDAFCRTVASFINPGATLTSRKAIWTRFAMWLLLGLEFELAADVIRTAIAPNWTDIGQLAAIATIRTVLNIFLERDIERSNAVTP